MKVFAITASFAIMSFVRSFSFPKRLIARSQQRLFMDASGGDKVLNKYSRTITENPMQGASQAMLYATGLTPQTISSPQVQITLLQ